MRFCQSCSARGVTCRVTRQSLKCENCYRYNLKCDLASNYQGMNKALKEAKKLNDEILELRLKLARKEKQRKHWRRRLKDLDDHESQNILKIEATKVIDEPPFDLVNDVISFFKLSPQALTSLFDFLVDETLEATSRNSQGS